MWSRMTPNIRMLTTCRVGLLSHHVWAEVFCRRGRQLYSYLPTCGVDRDTWVCIPGLVNATWGLLVGAIPTTLDVPYLICRWQKELVTPIGGLLSLCQGSSLNDLANSDLPQREGRVLLRLLLGTRKNTGRRSPIPRWRNGKRSRIQTAVKSDETG